MAGIQPSVGTTVGSFEADSEVLAYSSYVPPARPAQVSLSLHGAGPAGRQRIAYLAEHLVARGSSLFCFDFSGHGESTGKLSESTLTRRRHQAQSAVRVMGEKPTLLIGTSMGGHVASSIITEVTPEYLLLFCPALYGDHSVELPFDTRFTAAIRLPLSFETSSVRNNLARFSGKSLIIVGDDDQVIPPRVIDIYRNELAKSGKNHVLRISDAPHNIHEWAILRPENAALITAAVDDFLSG